MLSGCSYCQAIRNNTSENRRYVISRVRVEDIPLEVDVNLTVDRHAARYGGDGDPPGRLLKHPHRN